MQVELWFPGVRAENKVEVGFSEDGVSVLQDENILEMDGVALS